MKVGILAVSVGPYSTGDFIRRSAQAAERVGFSSYSLGDHVLLFGEYPESPYPYAGVNPAWGDPPIPDPRLPLYEPVTGMAWAAAATERIEVSTYITILPQRNPVVLAKELSCLDEYCGGRVTLGVGVGWCKEEMDAINDNWTKRGKRTDEYIAAMRTLWRNDEAEFHGESISFKNAFMYPKPVRNNDIPIMIGGDTDVALKRVARIGDGWLAFHLPVEQAADRVALLKKLTQEQGRDPNTLRISSAVFTWTEQDDLERYRDAGITEFMLVKSGELPVDKAEMEDHLGEAGRKYVDFVADW